MKIINAATCSDNYDFVLTNDGRLSIEENTGSAVANMLKFDFICNDDWVLDNELGIHWLSDNNDGLMQVKNSEVQIVSAIQRKLLSFDGVKEIKEMTINRGINRKLYIDATVIVEDGSSIKLIKEVS